MAGGSDQKQKFRYSIAKNLPKVATNKERYTYYTEKSSVEYEFS